MYNKNINLIKFSFRILYLLLFIFLIKISFNWSKFNNSLKIKSLQFSKTTILDNKIYNSLLDSLIEKNNSYLDISKINQIIEKHPYVKAARVSNHYPGKIKIEIIEREPIAIIKINPIIMIDEDGFILPDLDNSKNYNLPYLTNFNSEDKFYPIGEKTTSIAVNECIKCLSNIKNNYNYIYDNLSELKITSTNEIELILFDHPTYIFLGQNKIESRLQILKYFKHNLKPKKISDYTYVDLRFKNQIIVKERHS